MCTVCFPLTELFHVSIKNKKYEFRTFHSYLHMSKTPQKYFELESIYESKCNYQYGEACYYIIFCFGAKPWGVEA